MGRRFRVFVSCHTAISLCEPGSGRVCILLWVCGVVGFRGSLESVCFLCGQVFKGTRWMPWHQEPKKDVGICDKPGGVDNRTVIPGCPNGETPPDAFA